MRDDTVEKKQSYRIFDSIFRSYDLINRVLSLGQDKAWRRELISRTVRKSGLKILDLATGTCDVGAGILMAGLKPDIFCGLDLSEKMLLKAAKRGLSEKISFVRADSHFLPFEKNSFDSVTAAFGIRNMHSPLKVLQESRRVLKRGGRIGILEFSRPDNSFVRFFFNIYLRLFIPLAGGILSGNFHAYSYLNRTIGTFPCGEDFLGIMRDAGFEETECLTMMLGSVTLYTGEKKNEC